MECQELKERIRSWEESHQKDADEVIGLLGQKARLKEELARNIALIRNLWYEKDKLSIELIWAKTCIWKLEHENTRFEAERDHVMVESILVIGRCIEEMTKAAHAMAEKSEAHERLKLACQEGAKQIARLRAFNF